jgi:hypothetical protein
MKICTKCKIEKEDSEFHKDKRSKDGFRYECKVCAKEYGKKYRVMSGVKDQRREYCKKYRAKPEVKERKREYCYKSKYNITLEEYDKMCCQQNGRCLICEEKPNKLVVDHDHKTGKVRGLLCNSCNLAIGYLKENKQHFMKAIEYLERDEIK